MQPDINPVLNEITSSLFRVSAKLLIIQDDKLLVVEEDQGWYGLPGGGIDHGEPVLDTLVREVNEEIGLTIVDTDMAPLPVFIDSTSIFDGIPRFTLLYKYLNNSKAVTPTNLELRFRWISADEFSELQLAPNIAPMRSTLLSAMAHTGL